MVLARRPDLGDALRSRLQPFADAIGGQVWVHPDGQVAFAGSTPPSQNAGAWCLTRDFSVAPVPGGECARRSSEVLTTWLASGDSGVGLLEGELAAALYRDRALHLHRDRFGFGSLFVWETPECWVVVSHLRALRHVAGWDLRLSALGLETYVAYGRLPGDRTLFDGVTKVPPASCQILPAGPSRLLWIPDFGTRPDADEEEALQYLDHRLSQLLARWPADDTELWFSGGVDSALLLALSAKAGTPLPLHTLVYPGRKKVDAGTVQPLAEQFGAPLQLSELPADLDPTIDSLAAALQQPDTSMGLIGFTTLFAEAPRNHCVMGMGADIVAANFVLQGRIARMQRWSWVPQPVVTLLRSVVGARNVPLNILLGDTERLLQAGIPFLPAPERRRLLRTTHPTNPEAVDRVMNSLETALPAGTRLFHRFQFLRLIGRLCTRNPSLLELAAYHGRRCVCPFMDADLFQYHLGLPSGLTCKGGEGKYVVRELLRRQQVDMRQVTSQAVRLPLEAHLRQHLDELREELLGPQAPLREHLNPGRVHRRLTEHRLGRNRTKVLWPLLLLSRWLQSWR